MNNSTASFHRYDYNMQVSFAFKAAFYAAISAVTFVSLIGNTLEIITFLKTKNLRTSTNYFITSTAVSDAISVVIHWVLYSRSTYSVFTPSMTFNELPMTMCKLSMFVTYVSYTVSIASLVLISADRFIAIVLAMKAKTITRRTRAISISITWILAFGIGIPGSYFSRMTTDAERPYFCTTDMSSLAMFALDISFFVLYYFVPLLIITILSFCIIKALRRTNPAIQNNSGQINMRRAEQSRRVMKILISINFVFVVCWTPAYVVIFLLQYFEMHVREMLFITCFYFLPLVSGAFNPVILFTFSTNYRQALKQCLCVLSQEHLRRPRGRKSGSSGEMAQRKFSSRHFARSRLTDPGYPRMCQESIEQNLSNLSLYPNRCKYIVTSI